MLTGATVAAAGEIISHVLYTLDTELLAGQSCAACTYIQSVCNLYMYIYVQSLSYM